MKLTAREARDVVQRYMEGNGIQCKPRQVTARTVSFIDLARDEKVFVKVTGWNGEPAIRDQLLAIARHHGFRVTFHGPNIIV